MLPNHFVLSPLFIALMLIDGNATGQTQVAQLRLTGLFYSSNCTVTNANGVRPKISGNGNEQLGCADAAITGRRYSAPGNPSTMHLTPVGSSNILIHPPQPSEVYTRVTFLNLDAIQSGLWQTPDWAIEFTAGIAYAQGSTCDGVELRVYCGSMSGGQVSGETELMRRTFAYPDYADYFSVALPRHLAQRSACYLAFETRPIGNNFFDHFFITNPVVAPAVAGVSLVDAFSPASVFAAGQVPLTKSWSTLSANFALGGAAVVPQSLMTGPAAPYQLPQGNIDPSHTVIIHPPAPASQWCRVRWPLASLMPLPLLLEHDWLLSFRMGLNSQVSAGDGVRVSVSVEGYNPYNVFESTTLISTVVLAGSVSSLSLPLGVWTARDSSTLSIVVEPLANNTNDQLLVEGPFLVALPMSHGLDHVADFGFFMDYLGSSYPNHAGTYLPSAQQFDDTEPYTTCMLVVGDQNVNFQGFQERCDEARHLGQSVIALIQNVFIPYGTMQGLWSDYQTRWDNVKTTLIAPNIDVIKYLYFEELYSFRQNVQATNSDLVSIANTVTPSLTGLSHPPPQLLLVDYDSSEFGSSAVDIPSSWGAVGFEGWYPTTAGSSPRNDVRARLGVLSAGAKPGHRLVIIPPAIDRQGANEIDKASIFEAFLNGVRVDERFTAILPWMWYWGQLPAFDGQRGLYDTPSFSGYRRRYLSLGQSIRERYRQVDATVGGQPMGCPGAAQLSVFSSEPLAVDVPFTISLRGAPFTPAALLIGSPVWSPVAFGCGYLPVVGPQLVSVIISTDSLGRYFLRTPAVAGPLDFYLQSGYLVGNDLDLTNVVRVNY